MSAHDPQRYISDMLAFLHQSIPGENENLISFLKGCDKTGIYILSSVFSYYG